MHCGQSKARPSQLQARVLGGGGRASAANPDAGKRRGGGGGVNVSVSVSVSVYLIGAEPAGRVGVVLAKGDAAACVVGPPPVAVAGKGQVGKAFAVDEGRGGAGVVVVCEALEGEAGSGLGGRRLRGRLVGQGGRGRRGGPGGGCCRDGYGHRG